MCKSEAKYFSPQKNRGANQSGATYKAILSLTNTKSEGACATYMGLRGIRGMCLVCQSPLLPKSLSGFMLGIFSQRWDTAK